MFCMRSVCFVTEPFLQNYLHPQSYSQLCALWAVHGRANFLKPFVLHRVSFYLNSMKSWFLPNMNLFDLYPIFLELLNLTRCFKILNRGKNSRVVPSNLETLKEHWGRRFWSLAFHVRARFKGLPFRAQCWQKDWCADSRGRAAANSFKWPLHKYVLF